MELWEDCDPEDGRRVEQVTSRSFPGSQSELGNGFRSGLF